jgi:hypothetical protein
MLPASCRQSKLAEVLPAGRRQHSITGSRSQSLISKAWGLSVMALASIIFWGPTSIPKATAQPAPIPPGVPEPGLIIWGSVVNQTNASQTITITSASWSVTDGTKTAVYSSASRPPTRIVNLNGQSFYVLQVPFDTRRIGTVTLADPATEGIDSFELKSASPPTYTLTPTINGALATVRSVDGAPASGANVPVAGFSAATRGRVIRVDLGIVPLGDDYETWAAAIFGNANLPDAARTADPDRDGLNNEGEHAAGTDPKDPASALRIVALTIQGQTLQAVVGWQSVSSRSYVIESAPSPEGPWGALSPAMPSAGATTQTSINLVPGEPKRFYRIRLAP